MESLGLAMAEDNHGRDQVHLHYTMGEVDMSARLRARLPDSYRNLHNKEVGRLAWPQYQIAMQNTMLTILTPFP